MELEQIEALIADPKIWNDPAQSQKILQRRKLLENDLNLDQMLGREI